MEKNNLEVVDFVLDEDGNLGMQAMGIVSDPAIQIDFVALSAQKDTMKVMLSEASKERRMLYGPVAVPDQLILRKRDDGTEYYMRLKAPVIAQLAYGYMKKNLHHTANVEHKYPVDGCVVVESWLKEGASDKSEVLGYDLPVGTWFIGMHVENDVVWEAAKEGSVNGFSLEASFQKLMALPEKEPIFAELEKLLSEFVGHL